MLKLKLKYPVTFNDETITEIELRRPKGRDIKILPTNPTTEHLLRLASKLSGQVSGVFDEMDAVDVMTVSEAIAGFLDRGQETGPS